MATFFVLVGCALLTAVAASPSASQQPTLQQARNWIHPAKEVEAELKSEKQHTDHHHLNRASLLSTSIKASEGAGATKLLRELGAASDMVQKDLEHEQETHQEAVSKVEKLSAQHRRSMEVPADQSTDAEKMMKVGPTARGPRLGARLASRLDRKSTRLNSSHW